MRFAITGHRGQLGSTLQQALAGHELLGLDRPEYDIADAATIRRALQDFSPDVVLHTAAYTDVDGCARNPDEALRINGLGAQNVALACRATGAAMLYISTNEVFAGDRQEPYLEYDRPAPINAYGYSKWVGERYVEQICPRFYIARFSWLFGGPSSFVTKILARAKAQGELAVVDDEWAAPTYLHDVVPGLVRLVQSEQFGVYHLVNEGSCSRYEMAAEILRLTGQEQIPLRPIKQTDFSRPSTPPPRAVLRNYCAAVALHIRLRPWAEALAAYLQGE